MPHPVSPALNPPIRQVTVYPEGALVRRRAKLSLTGQERSLIIAPLPEQIDMNSLQVAGRGIEVLILGVRWETRSQPAPAQDPPLANTLREQESHQQQLQARRESLQLQRRFVQQLSEQAVEPFAQNLAQQQVSLTKTQQFLTFIESQLLSISAAIAALDHQEQQLTTQITQLRQQLQAIYAAQPRPQTQVVIEINPLSAGDWGLELTYFVPAATWQPLYDLRWDRGSEQLNLSALAQVRQATGEDWSGVQLILSTAPPPLNGSLPSSPEPWYIDLPPNPFVHLRYSRERYQAASEETASLAELPADATELEAFPAVDSEPRVYEISGESTILSEPLAPEASPTQPTTPQLVTLSNHDLPVTWRPIAQPRRQTQPELEVIVQNPATDSCLLPGVGNLFRDGAYVGQVSLPSLGPETQLPLRFGSDPSLQVQRRLRDRSLDTNLRGNRHRLSCTYELHLQNRAEQESPLCVIEQLPLSRSDKIKVQLQRTKPKAEPDEQGNLIWELVLDGRSQQIISYQFTVEYPADLPVNGLNL
ncbi:MAG: mucoidy inhibitor MuiA family protein [Cyanobacteria bacterium P01_G01_bin.54]